MNVLEKEGSAGRLTLGSTEAFMPQDSFWKEKMKEQVEFWSRMTKASDGNLNVTSRLPSNSCGMFLMLFRGQGLVEFTLVTY